jgi:hypothetical protein
MSVSRGQVGFVISSAVVLALGVGAFILALGVGRGLWSRSTAVKDPERVVGIIGLSSLDGASESRVLGPGSLGRLRAMPHFEAVAGQGLTNGRHAEYTLRVSLPSGRRLEALAVTPEYFTLLGIAVRGRDFASGDDRPNAETAAIISDRIWREAFARRDDTIGSVVDTRASPVRVIGVVPAGFSGVRLGERVDIWVPAGVASRFSPVTPTERYGPLFVLARLRWGITPGDAERALADHDFFGRSGRNRLSALPIVDTYGSPADRTLRVEVPGVIALLPVVAAVALLAGCGTLTGLAIVYFERRRAEFAIRRALFCISADTPGVLRGRAGHSGRRRRRPSVRLEWISAAPGRAPV